VVVVGVVVVGVVVVGRVVVVGLVGVTGSGSYVGSGVGSGSVRGGPCPAAASEKACVSAGTFVETSCLVDVVLLTATRAGSVRQEGIVERM
jgi:hypothetical protein